MKRLFMALALATFIRMPLAAMNLELPENKSAVTAQLEDKAVTLVDAAPSCDTNRITQQEISIKQDEYKKSLIRAGVYLCAFAGASYLGYKLFKPVTVLAATSGSTTLTPEKTVLAATSDSPTLTPEKMAALDVVLENQKASSFLSGRWFKNLFIGVRDMAFQSAVLGGFYGVGTYLKQQLFYNKRIADFLVYSTYFVYARGELEGYASMLEESAEGACYRPIQELIQERTLLLCQSVERIAAYMHILRDGLETGSKDAFLVAEQFLIAHTNSALESLWRCATDTEKKPAELARSIALTLHIFNQDLSLAVDRFDTAYYLATQDF